MLHQADKKKAQQAVSARIPCMISFHKLMPPYSMGQLEEGTKYNRKQYNLKFKGPNSQCWWQAMKNRSKPVLPCTWLLIWFCKLNGFFMGEPAPNTSQSNKTYLSANPGILSRVKASLIQFITNNRLWQGFQENEESFSHRMITASWIDLS